jgi:PAS domain S-box-containing protein
LINILHIDVNDSENKMLNQSLEGTFPEFHVLSTSSLADAISIVLNNKIDILLIFHSNLINIFEFISTLKKISKAPIIVYSNQDDSHLNHTIDIVVDDYIILGTSSDQQLILSKQIKKIIETHRDFELGLSILDSGIIALVVVSDEKILYANSFFEKLLLVNKNSIINSSFLSYIPQTDWIEVRKMLQNGGEGTLNLSSSNGVVYNYKVVIRPIVLSGRNSMLVLIHAKNEELSYNVKLDSLRSFVPKILFSPSINEIIKNTLDIVETCFNADFISYLTIENNEISCFERRWKKNNMRYPFSSDGYISRCLNEGKTCIINNPEKSSLDEIIFKSELLLPIKNINDKTDIISIKSSSVNAYDHYDLTIARDICLYVECAYRILSESKTTINSGIQYSNLITYFNEAIYIISNSSLIYLNQKGAELIGYLKPSDILGTDIFNYIAPEFKEFFKNKLNYVLKSGTSDKYEIKLITPNNISINVEVNGSFIVFNDQPAYLAVVNDITNNKYKQEQFEKYTRELEKQIKQSSQEMFEAQQFIAAGKLASMVGHDLRSPLQSIKNAIYIMRKQPEQAEDMYQSIELSVNRALSMLEDLRNKTRETPLKIEPTNLPEIIMNIIKDTQIPDNIFVDLRLDPNLKIVEIDSLKIRRVIDNIIRNAVEAMPRGGTLIIETSTTPDHFIINIKDDGVGISEENKRNLFRPFYTTKTNGLGLGLAYSQKAVEAHGGTIEVISEIGKGTIFKITLNQHQSIHSEGGQSS